MNYFVTHSDKNYLPVVEKFFETVEKYSKNKILYFTINYDYEPKHSCVIPIRYDLDIVWTSNVPKEERNILGNSELVRANMLFVKSKICYEALKQGDHTYCFVDSDSFALPNCDEIFDRAAEITNYPLLGRNVHDYMIYDGRGNPWVGEEGSSERWMDKTLSLEYPLFKLLGIPIEKRADNYKQSNLILYNQNCEAVMREWKELCFDQRIVDRWEDFAAFNDETILNVVLWKYEYNHTIGQPCVNIPWIFDGKITSNDHMKRFVYEIKNPRENGWFFDIFAYIPPKDRIHEIKFFHGRCTAEQFEVLKKYYYNNEEIIGEKVNLFEITSVDKARMDLAVFKGGDVRLEVIGLYDNEELKICDDVIPLGGPSGIFFRYPIVVLFKKLKLRVSIGYEYDEKIIDVLESFPCSKDLSHLTSEELLKIKEIPWFIYEEIFINKVYDKPKMFEGVKNCIDIGSNSGFFTMLAFKHGVEHVKCIEPDVRLNMYSEVLNKDNLDKFEIINKAFYSKSGEMVTLHISDTKESGAQSIIENYTYNYMHNDTAEVETISFEDITKEYDVIDLLKVDCEGAEIYLFSEENLKIVEDKVKKVFIEFHLAPHEKIDTWINKIDRNKFHVYYKRLGDYQSINLHEVYILNKKYNFLDRIMYLLPHVSTGGMPQYVLEKIKVDVAEGKTVFVVENSYSGDAFVVQRNAMRKILGNNFIPVFENNERLLEVINSCKPDILHLQEEPALFWSMSDETLQKIYSTDRSYFIHETSHTSTYNIAEKKYFPDRFVFCGKYHYKTYATVHIGKELFEYNPPKKKQDKEFYLKKLKLDPKKKHIIQVGLFTSNKNQGHTFKIAEILKDYQFHFIGNMADNFKDYWSTILPNKPDNCILWYERDDVDAFLNIADAFMLPSHAEMNPISLKEALVYDIPSFCFDLETLRMNFDDPNIHWLTGNVVFDANIINEMFDASIKFKFGIATTFYNVADVMVETIESVLKQTYKNWTWFVTDDDSTDNTKEILLRYCKKHPNMVYCKQRFKKEMFWQPQHFISPDCDYILTVDADDVLLPKALEVYNRVLNQYKDDNIVSMSCDNVSYNETIDEDLPLNASYISFSGKYGDFLRDRTYDHEEHWSLKSLHIWGHLRCYKNVEGLDFFIDKESRGCNNDSLHFSIMQEYGNHLNVKRNLYLYRKRKSGISHKFLSDEEWFDTKAVRKISLDRAELSQGNVLQYYEEVYEEANAFLLSDLNFNVGSKVGLFTTKANKDFTELKKLYYDYDLSINEFRNDYDYILIVPYNDLEYLKTVLNYYTNKKYKQISVYYFEPLSRQFREAEKHILNTFEVFKNVVGSYSSKFDYNHYYRHFHINMEGLNTVEETKDDEIIETVTYSFHRGARCEIIGKSPYWYSVKFIDADTEFVIFEDNIKINHWTSCTRQYYTNWRIEITRQPDNSKMWIYNFNLTKKNVIIDIDSKQLGDNVAWMPYAEEFRKKHDCKVYLSTWFNRIFKKEYPEITFIEPGESIPDIYAVYAIGVSDNDYNRNKNNWRIIPLQQVATDYLGLDYVEIKPRITVEKKRPIKQKYITIAEHSTLQAKFYNYPNGWQMLVNHYKKMGYEVMTIGLDISRLKGVIDGSGSAIQDTVVKIAHSDLFIGISSGPSWLAWALGVPTVMISGLTLPYHEMQDCLRINNTEVCHGCFNDHNIVFDRGNWFWCPKSKNFICTISITPQSIIEKIQEKFNI